MSIDRSRSVFALSSDGQVTCDGRQIDLSRDTRLPLRDGVVKTLGDILDCYDQSGNRVSLEDILTADVQQAIGEVLYSALGEATFKRYGRRWIEISAEGGWSTQFGRFIAALPWPMTAGPSQTYNFLAQLPDDPWLFTLASGDGPEPLMDQAFPPEPRVLLAIPKDDEDQWSEHEAELKELLSESYTIKTFGDNVRIVRKWDDFRAVLSAANAWDPDVIYFYGHGRHDTGVVELLFDSGYHDVMGMADLLRALESRRRPAMIFLNCCNSGNAARLSARNGLAPLAACVVANRTIADFDAARKFGVEVMSGLVRDALPPHLFFPRATFELALGLGTRLGGRWACPVVHTNYSEWVALKPVGLASPAAATAGRFVDRLDRSLQVNKSVAVVRTLVRQAGFPLKALVWQAEPDQGAGELGRRILDELHSVYTTETIREIVVELQPDTRPVAHYEENILGAIHAALARSKFLRDVGKPDQAQVSDLLSVLTLLKVHLSARGVLLYVRTLPLPVDHDGIADLVRSYCAVWIKIRNILQPKVATKNRLRIVLALALDVPSNAYVKINELLGKNAAAPGVEVIDLDILGSVSVGDLVEHLSEYMLGYRSLPVSAQFDDTQLKIVATEIAGATEGRFIPTLIHLKKMADLT